MINEFHGRAFSCTSYVPSGDVHVNVTGFQRVCSAVGSKTGLDIVSGTDYLRVAYDFENRNKWRYVNSFYIIFCS